MIVTEIKESPRCRRGNPQDGQGIRGCRAVAHPSIPNSGIQLGHHFHCLGNQPVQAPKAWFRRQPVEFRLCCQSDTLFHGTQDHAVFYPEGRARRASFRPVEHCVIPALRHQHRGGPQRLCKSLRKRPSTDHDPVWFVLHNVCSDRYAPVWTDSQVFDGFMQEFCALRHRLCCDGFNQPLGIHSKQPVGLQHATHKDRGQIGF